MKQNVNKIPQVRFPEFDGEWKVKKLGEIAEFSKGKSISKKDIIENGENKCIRYGELYTLYNEKIEEVISYTNISKEKSVLSKKNDVIIPSSGETHIDIAKASCVLTNDIIIGGDLNIIRTNMNGVFLSYLLNGKKKIEVANLAQGSSVIHLYSSSLSLLKLPFPPLLEQQKIAHFFSTLDKKLNQLQEKKTALEQYKKGMMQKIFATGEKSMENGKLKMDNSQLSTHNFQLIRFKDDNGQDFPEWEFIHGNKIFERISNKKHNSDLPILAISQELGAVPRELINYTVSVTENSVSSYKVVDVGDFIISLRSFQGGIEYSNYKGICSPAYIILRPTIKIEDYFYKYYLKSYKYIQQLKSKLEGIRDGKMISYKYFSEIKIPYPNLEEQTKIANFLTKIDNKIKTVTEQIEQTKAYKKGLLQKMFV